jgi:hypothetical protein
MASNVAQGSTRLILIGSAMLLSIGMGLRQSLGLFLTPVTRDLALTAADFTLTIAIQNIVWGLSQAPVGAIADRFGLRVTLVAGTVIYIAGLAAMAAAGGEMALRRRASPRRLRATSDRPNRLHRCGVQKSLAETAARPPSQARPRGEAGTTHIDLWEPRAR